MLCFTVPGLFHGRCVRDIVSSKCETYRPSGPIFPCITSCSSNLSAKDRQCLRSEAGRREVARILSYVQLPEDPTRDPGLETAAEQLDLMLLSNELVRVKTGQKKKKLARDVGERLAAMVGAVVCQTIGHTVLVYKRAPENRKLRAGLRRIMLPSGEENTPPGTKHAAKSIANVAEASTGTGNLES